MVKNGNGYHCDVVLHQSFDVPMIDVFAPKGRFTLGYMRIHHAGKLNVVVGGPAGDHPASPPSHRRTNPQMFEEEKVIQPVTVPTVA